MKLAPGHPVVAFATVDADGHPVSLEQFRGRPLLLMFFRYASCSMRHGFWGGADLEMAKMPADFLVGPDGRLLLVHYGKDIGDHLSLGHIEKSLAELSGSRAGPFA
jgi:hypothetical protein